MDGHLFITQSEAYSVCNFRFLIFWAILGRNEVVGDQNFFFPFSDPPSVKQWPKTAKNDEFFNKKIFLFFTGPFMKEDQRNLREKFGKWPYFENMSTKIYVWGGRFLAKSGFSSIFLIDFTFFANKMKTIGLICIFLGSKCSPRRAEYFEW